MRRSRQVETGPRPRWPCVVHRASGRRSDAWPRACRMRAKWEADERPEPSSLGLLPSGPDPVGEWLVHRQPPGSYIGRTGEKASGATGAAHCLHTGAHAVRASAPLWTPIHVSLAPISVRSHARLPAKSCLERAAERRTDDACLAALAADAGARAYAIGGELVVLKKSATGLDPLFTPAEARALGRTTEIVFLGLAGRAGRFGIGLDASATEALKSAHRPARQRPALDRRAGPGRHRASAADRRSEGAAALARAPPLLRELRRADRRGAGRLAARLPRLRGRAFPAHRSGGDHAGGHGRALPARPLAPLRAQHVVVPRRLRRAGRGDRAGGAARDPEEAGITCGRVRYFASQPWPFPMSLMIGCHAEARRATSRSTAPSSRTRAGSTATRWRRCCCARHPDGLGTPPPVAIAHHIIRAWVEDEVAFR